MLEHELLTREELITLVAKLKKEIEAWKAEVKEMVNWQPLTKDTILENNTTIILWSRRKRIYLGIVAGMKYNPNGDIWDDYGNTLDRNSYSHFCLIQEPKK